jgi:hypothetical protein
MRDFYADEAFKLLGESCSFYLIVIDYKIIIYCPLKNGKMNMGRYGAIPGLD